MPIEDKKDVEVKETGSPPPPAPAPAPESVPEAPVKVETPVAEPPDLLSLDDSAPAVAELDEKNAMALAIVPVGMFY
nr:putative clathrin assembly protein At5g35200 [Ipomoea batatas]